MTQEQKHAQLLERMTGLPPLRNVNAMHAWMVVFNPTLAPIFELFQASAKQGNKTARDLLLFMMAAFAAGRAYQEANPDAPKDPNGYGQ
jgi:hypothetical protein